MREILFRGKALHSGKWVEGDLLNAGYDYITAIRKISGVCGEVIGIDPKTVGQYTGLTDKNGKKIFEGDIVSLWEDIYTCVFDEYNFGYECSNTKNDISFACVLAEDVEIIGNIYDNPELLKGGD